MDEATRQIGAIPFRVGDRGTPEIMLVTSRGTGRWVVPKGWPIPRLTGPGTALREAWEEAGIQGRIVGEAPIGAYAYRKRERPAHAAAIRVELFLLEVLVQKRRWPERHERRRRWCAPEEAAALVAEPELARLLASLGAVVAEATA